MSVLIKGMKMPKEGTVITIYKLKNKFYASIYGTELCPLVEVPGPHGRLIDASYKVDMPFYDDEYEENSVRTVTVEELLMMADNEVPTVVEAEGIEDA